VTTKDLKAVFLEQRPMLVRLLAARLGSREEAEDVVQEMWIRLERLTLRPLEQPGAYLFRMAANLAADRRIAASRNRARDSAWLEVQPGVGEQPDAERAMIARERLERIEASIAAMPERMRTALRMFRVGELPQKEIAKRLGVTVSAVEKMLRRAMRRIHEADQSLASADCGERHRWAIKDADSHG
jgi:RNA polymerase sigma-70 factor (ECF subfamily)